MPTTPNWEAARNGRPGHLDATNHAAQIDQTLGTHGITPIYEGTQIVTAAPSSNAKIAWLNYGNSTDLDQPFAMPAGHTAIGRVTLPVTPSGEGADLLVSLYPDNGSGSPNTTNLLAATEIPASWISSLTAPEGITSGGPLATARNNTLYLAGDILSTPWNFPAGSSTGAVSSASLTTSGNYLIMCGGFNISSPLNTVFTAQYLGGSVLAQPLPQPALPQATGDGMVTTTPTAIVFTGGNNATSQVNNTWVAGWDPNTGAIGSWSAQAALPKSLDIGGAASWQDTVYIAGGYDGTNVLNTVYYATVTNGQLASWQTGPPLPVAVTFPILATVGNWLIFSGGNVSSGPGANGDTYYSVINPDGSLGGWQLGPTMPVPVYPATPGWSVTASDSALIVVGGTNSSGTDVSNLQILPISKTGPADSWTNSIFTLAVQGSILLSAFNTGTDGQWELISPFFAGSFYYSSTLTPVPLISIPLNATGLTAGATYHLAIQQHQTSSAVDYLSYGILNGSALPTAALKSSRHSGTWATAQAGYSVPLTVYDRTAGGPILHAWEDPTSTGSQATSNLASRTSTFVYNQQSLLIGVCESTNLPNEPLNSNPTFTSGTSPWTAHNGAVSQSSAQTHGGYAFSGLLTPTGGSATASLTSELVPIRAVFPQFSNAQWYQINGWFYSPAGWSNVSLSVDWYDATSTYITTSNSTTSLAAATWTNLVSTYQPPTNAAFASINMIEAGSPGATNVLYLSNVTIALSPELTTALAPVSEITYGSGLWPPTGVTQLA